MADCPVEVVSSLLVVVVVSANKARRGCSEKDENWIVNQSWLNSDLKIGYEKNNFSILN